MLGSLRKNTSNWFLKGMLILVAVAMGMFGVDQLGRQGSGAGAPAAWVNGEVITQSQFQRELSFRLQYFQQLLGSQYNEKLLASLRIPEQTLDGLIQKKLLAQQAGKMDILVSDVELAQHIRSLPYLQKNGKFDEESYSKLPNRGVEEAIQREDLQVNKLRQYLENRIRLSPKEIQKNLVMQKQRIKVAYAEINFKDIGERHKPNQAQIKKILAETPEKELRTYYDSEKAEFTTKAKVKLRQIRVGIPFQASDEKKKEARKKIDAIAKEVNATNFASVAQKQSDDEFAKKGGARGWVDRGTLDPNLEAALDSLAPGTVSNPVETTFGLFILLVEESKPEVVKEFAAVKQSIATKLAQETFRKNFEEEKRKQWSEDLAANKSIESDLRRYGVKIKTTTPFSVSDGRIPDIGNDDDIIDAAFALGPKKRFANKLFPYRGNFYFLKYSPLTSKEKKGTNEKKPADIERSMQVALRTTLFSQWIEDLKKTSTIKQELQFSGR